MKRNITVYDYFELYWNIPVNFYSSCSELMDVFFSSVLSDGVLHVLVVALIDYCNKRGDIMKD